MKVAIIGKNSYIGNNIDSALSKNPDTIVEQLDVLNYAFDSFDYSKYNVIIHVAAIVHRKDIMDYETYKRINIDMPVHVAEISKSQGVNQMVFFSSMAVY